MTFRGRRRPHPAIATKSMKALVYELSRSYSAASAPSSTGRIVLHPYIPYESFSCNSDNNFVFIPSISHHGKVVAEIVTVSSFLPSFYPSEVPRGLQQVTAVT